MRIVNYLADEFKKGERRRPEEGQDGAAASEGSGREGEDRAVELVLPDRDQPALHLDGPSDGQPLHMVMKLTRAKLESLVGDLIKPSR
jgi:molecular chaperone DnaK